MYAFLSYRACDAMTPGPVTVGPGTTLAEAETIFEHHPFNSLPVVDDERQLLGVFTKLDLLKAFRQRDDRMFPPYDEIMRQPVSAFMTLERDLATATPRMPLTRVLEKMVETRSKSLPVVDAGALVGMVAREDLMKALRRAVAGEVPTDPI